MAADGTKGGCVSEHQRYPLSWPNGWKRTPYSHRRHAAFHARKTVYGSPRPDGSRSSWAQKESLTVGKGLERLEGELRRLGATQVIISSNLRIRLDGLPYAQQATKTGRAGTHAAWKCLDCGKTWRLVKPPVI